MTRSDDTRSPAHRLAGLDGRARRDAGVLTPERPAPTLEPGPRLDPPTVPLPIPGTWPLGEPESTAGPAPGARAPGRGLVRDRYAPVEPEDALGPSFVSRTGPGDPSRLRRAARPGPDDDPGHRPRPEDRDHAPGAPRAQSPAAEDPAHLDDLPDTTSHGARPPLWRRVALRWLPPSLVGARVDPGRPGAIALVLVVVVAAFGAGIGVWANRPVAQPVSGLPEVHAGAAGPTGREKAAGHPGTPVPGAPVASGPVGANPVVVSVVGKVRRPGLVRLTDGARVADALDAAGGTRPGVDLTAMNLARRLGDGEQIAIGVPPARDAAPAVTAPGAEPASGTEPGAATASGGGTGGSAGSSAGAGAAGGKAQGKVDLNRGTLQDFDALPGVGPVTAQKIIDWRTKNGRFSRVEQLREIDGIGERRFSQLKEVVSL
ncbi:helix-hairpin-helix domain-containing protein [Pseudonocardia phyllosphaerae]|uniref:helix-hairpin-helix domain-containing protein n=1 Tax=Pseudonocardia phyllosphaerae TaxID=3390502 RepID=UPI00397CC7E5